MRRFLLGLTLAIAVSMTHAPQPGAQSAKTHLADPAQAKLFNDISERLVCQCGCQMMLSVCNHVNCPSAIPMRHEIEKGILAGVSPDSIVAGFVEKDGLKVLSSPPAEGLNLAAWVMPGFALMIGLFFLFYFAANWARKRRVAATVPVAQIDDVTRARIEREIEEMKS